MKLEINNRKINEKKTITWRLNNMLLKKQWVNKEIKKEIKKYLETWDFPGGPVIKNTPYSAGDTGSIPCQGTKIPHAVGQLSPRATTTELTRLN